MAASVAGSLSYFRSPARSNCASPTASKPGIHFENAVRSDDDVEVANLTRTISDELRSARSSEMSLCASSVPTLAHSAGGPGRLTSPHWYFPEPTRNGKSLSTVFMNVAEMKEKVRMNLVRPKTDVTIYYKTQGCAQCIARSNIFEFITLAVIGVNAIWIAIDTDLNKKELLVDAHPVFQVAENMFCCYFFFEWCVRFLAFRKKLSCLQDGWFVFDSCLVFTMVLETWVMTAVALFTSSGGSATDANKGSILKIARLMKVSRMARMARLLRAMPELMILIKGMLAAMRSVVFTLLLLLIITYVFAIAFTQLAAEIAPNCGRTYFSSVPASMYHLTIYGTLLDNIGVLASNVGKESPAIAVMFIVFVLLSALTVMNMLIGVLCEVVSSVAKIENEEMQVGYVTGKLHKVVECIDQDKNMKISKREFIKILENQEAVRCLRDVGVDVVGLVDRADAIFEDPDEWDFDGTDEATEITFAKFMEVVLALRGCNTATVKDVVDLRKFVRTAILQTNQHLLDRLDDLRLSMHTCMAGVSRMAAHANKDKSRHRRHVSANSATASSRANASASVVSLADLRPPPLPQEPAFVCEQDLGDGTLSQGPRMPTPSAPMPLLNGVVSADPPDEPPPPSVDHRRISVESLGSMATEDTVNEGDILLAMGEAVEDFSATPFGQLVTRTVSTGGRVHIGINSAGDVIQGELVQRGSTPRVSPTAKVAKKIGFNSGAKSDPEQGGPDCFAPWSATEVHKLQLEVTSLSEALASSILEVNRVHTCLCRAMAECSGNCQAKNCKDLSASTPDFPRKCRAQGCSDCAAPAPALVL